MVEKTNKLFSMSFSLTGYEEYIPFHIIYSSGSNIYTKIYDIINFINDSGMPDRTSVLMNDIPLYYYEKEYGILHISVNAYNDIMDSIVQQEYKYEYGVLRKRFESILNRYITAKPAIYITNVPNAKYKTF